MLITTIPKIQYTLTEPFPTSFSIPYRYFDKSNIFAYLSFIGKNPQELSIGTHYTLTDPADTGTMTRVGTWDADAIRLTIVRILDEKQDTDLQNGDNYNAETVEQMHDKAIAMIQQLQEAIGRAIKLSITDERTEALDLPDREDMKNSFIVGDADGNLSTAKGLASVPISAFMATLVDDLNAAAGRTTLDVYGKSEVYQKVETYSDTEIDALIDAVEALVAAEAKKPPIGIPTLWFDDVPDWALAFDDGSGPYDWADYPELETDAFKSKLTKFSDNGWMSAYTDIQFYVPDLRGMAFQLAGISTVRQMANNSYFDGGNIGDYVADMLQGFRFGGRYRSGTGNGDYVGAGALWPGTISPIADTSNGPPRIGAKTKPATATIRLIVRFE